MTETLSFYLYDGTAIELNIDADGIATFAERDQSKEWLTTYFLFRVKSAPAALLLYAERGVLNKEEFCALRTRRHAIQAIERGLNPGQFRAKLFKPEKTPAERRYSCDRKAHQDSRRRYKHCGQWLTANQLSGTM